MILLLSLRTLYANPTVSVIIAMKHFWKFLILQKRCPIVITQVCFKETQLTVVDMIWSIIDNLINILNDKNNRIFYVITFCHRSNRNKQSKKKTLFIAVNSRMVLYAMYVCQQSLFFLSQWTYLQTKKNRKKIST